MVAVLVERIELKVAVEEQAEDAAHAARHHDALIGCRPREHHPLVEDALLGENLETPGEDGGGSQTDDQQHAAEGAGRRRSP